MNNTYIVTLDNFTEEDAELAKKLDKSDNLVFISNEEGTVSWKLIPYFNAWKANYAIMPPVSVEFVKGIMIGIYCSDATGSINLITADEDLMKLDGLSLETRKGTVTIKVCESFVPDIDTGKKRKAPSKENMAKDTGKRSVSEDTGIALMSDDEYLTAPEDFRRSIGLLQSKTKLIIEGHENALFECIKNAPEGIISTLEYQVELRFKQEVVSEVTILLEQYYEMLKESAETEE